MSDIRAQARRDAEFDRMLAECGGIYSENQMRAAYEMGDRHRAEQCPRWHDAPTCPGRWIASGEYDHAILVTDPESYPLNNAWAKWRWYGPIPADEVAS